MIVSEIKKEIFRNISNIPGWRTKRKLVVIESDDWGSIRMPSKEAFTNLKVAGIPVEKNHYNLYDSLESNQDLELLFETLSKLTDKTGRPPVMTGVNIVANPDFEKIKQSGYSQYFYEPFTETLKRYPEHDNVYQLWKKGIQQRLFVPIFHGREHLNVQHWLKALQKENKSTLLAFNQMVTGIPRTGVNNEVVPDFQAAFDLETIDDLKYMKEVLKTGLKLFEELFGYQSRYFVPTNGPFNNTLEEDLNNYGVNYINTAKRQAEPLGNSQYKTNTRFIGQKNKFGQTYITRNCFFEPSSSGFERPENTDWVNNCLKEIEIAFRWNKPAIISTHRVNYIGFLHPENREKGLSALTELLTCMLSKWPDIEFVTSVELGDLIATSN